MDDAAAEAHGDDPDPRREACPNTAAAPRGEVWPKAGGALEPSGEGCPNADLPKPEIDDCLKPSDGEPESKPDRPNLAAAVAVPDAVLLAEEPHGEDCPSAEVDPKVEVAPPPADALNEGEFESPPNGKADLAAPSGEATLEEPANPF